VDGRLAYSGIGDCLLQQLLMLMMMMRGCFSAELAMHHRSAAAYLP